MNQLIPTKFDVAVNVQLDNETIIKTAIACVIVIALSLVLNRILNA